MFKLSFIKDVYSFFSNKEKNYFHLLIFLIVIATILELIGLGMIIPVLEIFVNEDAIHTNRLTNFLLNYFDFISKEKFILFFCILLVAVFLIKSIVLATIIRFNIIFTNFLHYSWTTKLFEIYTFQPFKFFSINNSSILIRNIKDEISRTVHGVILPLSNLIAEILLIVGVLTFLVYLQPIMTIIALIYFITINFTYFFITKKFLYIWGKQKQIYEGLRLKNLIQTFNGIKEVKLNSSEKEFIQMYYKDSQVAIVTDGKRDFINALPRLMFEILSIIVFVIFVYIIVLSNKTLTEFLPIMGVFAFAAFKLLPSSNKILSCFQLIRFHYPAFNLIKKELNLKKDIQNQGNQNEISFEDQVDIINISKSYDGNEVLKDLNISIKKNEYVGIVGKSGSGKSTLLNLILGLIEPDKGDILSDSKSIFNSIKNWQKKISFIPQEIFLFDDTIKRNIAFTYNDKKIDEDKVIKCLEEANLLEYINNLPNGINTTVGERGLKISGGQKQRLGIARALYKNSEILIFDEATSNLDLNTENELIKSIVGFKGKKTIIIVAHRMNIINYCDKVYEIEDHKLKLTKIDNLK